MRKFPENSSLFRGKIEIASFVDDKLRGPAMFKVPDGQHPVMFIRGVAVHRVVVRGEAKLAVSNGGRQQRSHVSEAVIRAGIGAEHLQSPLVAGRLVARRLVAERLTAGRLTPAREVQYAAFADASLQNRTVVAVPDGERFASFVSRIAAHGVVVYGKAEPVALDSGIEQIGHIESVAAAAVTCASDAQPSTIRSLSRS